MKNSHATSNLPALLLALLALVACAGVSAAATGVKVALQPALTSVSPGDTFYLDINVTRAGSAFNGYTAVIGFDPSVLQFLPTSPLSQQEGALMTGACGNTFHQFTAGASQLGIDHSLLCNGVSLTGPGQVYRLRFKALAGITTSQVRFLSGLQFYKAGVAVNPDSSVDATVQLPSYPILASAGAGGTISPSGTINVIQGNNQSFTIAPNSGFHLVDVLVDGSSVGAVPSYTFTNVRAPHTISARFSANTFTITATAGSGGGISPSGAVSVNQGASQVFTFSPDPGHQVVDVQVDGLSVGAVTSYTFNNVQADHAISATFAIPTVTITASAGANGSITPSGAVGVSFGGSQAFTMMPAAGYHVLDVLVDGVSVGAVTSYTFNSVSANHTISVTFAINVYTITASAGANGSITPPGAVGVSFGGSQAFTMTPATGHHVLDVLVDGASVGAVTSYTFNSVSANHTISVTFAINLYAITASAGANGSISPSGAVAVPHGGSQAFTVTPDAHYHVTGVKVDGSPIGAVLGYTFSNVIGNHTIAATFGIDSFTVTATAGPDGSISPAGPVAVPYGANRGFLITPNAGFHVSDVLLDGISVGPVPQYAFTYTLSAVAADHTLQALFDAGTPVGVEGDPSTAGPLRVRAFPNPSRGAIELTVRSPGPGTQILEVFDMTGRRVRRLESGSYLAGMRRVAWDGRDESGSRVASGIYQVLLTSGSMRARTRITLLR